MNSLGCLGGPGFFGSGRVRVGPAMVWAGFGPGLRICGPGRPIARLDGEREGGGGVSLSGEDSTTGRDKNEDDPLAFSCFLSIPLTSSSIPFPSISTTPRLRNGYHSPNTLASPAPTSTSKEFTPQPLTRPIPSGLLHPKPK